MQARVLRDEAAQEGFGARLAAACAGSALIFLEGDLGAGKTTMTRGFIRALGQRGAVKSPTYTLIEPYDIGDRRVYHLDLYRVADPGELEYLGLREMLAEDAVVLIEWAERGARWLPVPDLRVRIEHLSVGRRVKLEAATSKGGEIMARLESNL
ncbi:MAG: tRNA (adenosine(37)-N6)-threonylcarbamoyltransferase complex ATPase subunit type 1 TsaE [Sedimenticolaceae bacterium]